MRTLDANSISALTEVTSRAVVAFVNWTVFEVVLPVLVTDCKEAAAAVTPVKRLPSPIKYDADSMFPVA
jgi:hypothetical protein